MNDQINYTPLQPQQNPEKQEITGNVKRGPGNLTGKGGFQDHPEFINRNGRPKRKTITELLYEKLEEPLPNNPDKKHFDIFIQQLVIYLFGRKDKSGNVVEKPDKEIFKTAWNYLDGMPKQKHEVSGEDGSPIQFAVVAGTGFVPGSPDLQTTSAGSAVGQPGTVQGTSVAPQSPQNNDRNNGTNQAGTA